MLAHYKFALAVTDEQTIAASAGAIFLDVQVQDGQICLWALVNPETETVSHRVKIYGTGNIIQEPEKMGSYVGSVQIPPYVWHVYVES